MFKSIVDGWKKGWNDAPAYVPPTLEEMGKSTKVVVGSIEMFRATHTTAVKDCGMEPNDDCFGV